MVLAAVAVLKYHVLGRNRRLYGREGYVGFEYSEARNLELLAVLSASLVDKQTKRMKNLFFDRALLAHVELTNFSHTGVPLYGAGRDLQFTSKKYVMSDMRKVFEEHIDYIQPIVARLLYELGLASYRASIDLSSAIVREQREVVRYISKDKTRNKVDFYDVAKIYRRIRGLRHKLSLQKIKEIKQHQDQLRKLRQESQLKRRVDRTRVPSRQISIMDYYRSYRDFQRYDKIKSFKSQSTKRYRRLDPGPPLTENIVSQDYVYEEPRFHSRLKSKEIDFIINNMKYQIFASLRLGATMRHKSEYSEPFHQHLLNRQGAFSIAYERIRDDNSHLRAVIYDYGSRKKRRQLYDLQMAVWQSFRGAVAAHPQGFAKSDGTAGQVGKSRPHGRRASTGTRESLRLRFLCKCFSKRSPD